MDYINCSPWISDKFISKRIYTNSAGNLSPIPVGNYQCLHLINKQVLPNSDQKFIIISTQKAPNSARTLHKFITPTKTIKKKCTFVHFAWVFSWSIAINFLINKIIDLCEARNECFFLRFLVAGFIILGSELVRNNESLQQ